MEDSQPQLIPLNHHSYFLKRVSRLQCRQRDPRNSLSWGEIGLRIGDIKVPRLYTTEYWKEGRSNTHTHTYTPNKHAQQNPGDHQRCSFKYSAGYQWVHACEETTQDQRKKRMGITMPGPLTQLEILFGSPRQTGKLHDLWVREHRRVHRRTLPQ